MTDSNATMLSAEDLRCILDYNPETGLFKWRNPKGRLRAEEAGWINLQGYRQICIRQKAYQAHRLAWLYVNGKWPSDQIDHINRNRADNRICNLREATNSQNAQNTRTRRDNKSGYRGVRLHQGKWRAEIAINGKQKHIGCFETPELAYAAYLQAAAVYHSHHLTSQIVM